MNARLVLLAVGLVAAVCGLLVVHARRLDEAVRNPAFVRFVRRPGQRNRVAKAKMPDHGCAVDRFGAPLSLAEPGSTFQHVLDDLSLAADGDPVRLSIDADLQTVATDALAGRAGAVVALEPTTGRIRVLVSSPAAASLNRALRGLYPPGSTFKIFMAAAALTDGLDPVFNCPAAGYRSARGTKPIRDVEAYMAERRGRTWKGFGRLNMDAALVHSSNVYFAQLGVAMGPDRYGHAVEKSRLREGVTVLPARSISLVSADCAIPDGLKPAQLAPVALGQGALQLTPLAVAMMTAAVANDGVLLEPTLLETTRPVLRARPFSFAAAARVKRMMRDAVVRGTGRACELPGLDVCGKTGTAQTGRGKDHAWFTCFAPAKAPRLVVTVVVEQGGFGATAALPVARQVLEAAERQGCFQ